MSLSQSLSQGFSQGLLRFHVWNKLFLIFKHWFKKNGLTVAPSACWLFGLFSLESSEPFYLLSFQQGLAWYFILEKRVFQTSVVSSDCLVAVSMVVMRCCAMCLYVLWEVRIWFITRIYWECISSINLVALLHWSKKVLFWSVWSLSMYAFITRFFVKWEGWCIPT